MKAKLADYELAYKSRQASLIGRKEVLTGKAKFGIFGDGKEVAQIALAKAFQPGDFRSGYYRDQTLMFALGISNISEFFAQLYADTNIENDPASGGRGMNCHFGSRLLDAEGNFKNQLSQPNSSADISPTGGQMARLVGLAYASKLYRNVPEMAKNGKLFSNKGNEVAFGTIGDASTSEGVFWESLNAAGVLQIPLVMTVWDDGYGISVPKEFQTTKGSISEALKGFQRKNKTEKGFEIFTARGWNYEECITTYAKASKLAREEHVPCLVHIQELTQPQGHSTSGSHERYKTKERLDWEAEWDCLVQLRKEILSSKVATESQLTELETAARKEVEALKTASWENYLNPLLEEKKELFSLFEQSLVSLKNDGRLVEHDALKGVFEILQKSYGTTRKSFGIALHSALLALRNLNSANEVANLFRKKHQAFFAENEDRYCSHLHSETALSKSMMIESSEIKAEYSAMPEQVDGRVVLLKCFENIFEKHPTTFALGEDVGKLGDVNLVFEGLQAKFGELRVTDTGIREATILGQGIGAALRGLRPLVDIQYLDYLLYALQLMSDDLSCLHYRTRGGQKAPVIMRTKGHRLEGVWHTGSPIGMILSSVRGMHVCVPRNCTQAAGMYNTLIEGDNPALVIEVLNAYRNKENMPNNVGTFTVPLGMPEILSKGVDITIVTYGACVKVAQEALPVLENVGISAELIDVQTLLPFDVNCLIRKSLEKTGAVLFFDEDVPGSASAFMYQQVIENQNAFDLLDLPPATLCAKPNRSPYGSDGDYFVKPNAEDVVNKVYNMMRGRNADKFPNLFG